MLLARSSLDDLKKRLGGAYRFVLSRVDLLPAPDTASERIAHQVLYVSLISLSRFKRKVYATSALREVAASPKFAARSFPVHHLRAAFGTSRGRFHETTV